MRILTCDVPALVACLRTGYFRRAGIRVTTAGSATELLERAAVLEPGVILVVAGLLEPHGERDLARRLRACLGERPALLLLAVPPERVDLSEDLLLYDGIVALDEPELDLARILSPLSGGQREAARLRVEIPVELELEAGRALAGTTTDISAAGAGLLVGARPDRAVGQARFFRADGRSVTLGVRPLWWYPAAGAAVRVGVRFLSATLDAVRALYDLALWERIEDAAGPLYRLHGEISERTSFATLLRSVPSPRRLDLAGVSRINSAGALRWVDFLRRAGELGPVALERVSVPLLRQMRLVPAMAQRAVLRSFYLPYECDDCDLENLELHHADRPRLPPGCPECARPMQLAEPLSPAMAPQAAWGRQVH